MANLDDLCEAYDDLSLSGDTPMRFKLDGVFLEVAALHKEPDGTVTVELEEDEPKRRASIHWGGDGI